MSSSASNQVGEAGRALCTYVADILPRQQDLCDRRSNHPEQVVPHGNQPSLPDSRQSLFPLQPFPPILQLHPSKSYSNSTRRDEHDPMIVRRRSQDIDQVDKGGEEGELRGVRECRGDDRGCAYAGKTSARVSLIGCNRGLTELDNDSLALLARCAIENEKISSSATARATWHLLMLTILHDELRTGLFSGDSPSFKVRSNQNRIRFLPMILIASIVFKVS